MSIMTAILSNRDSYDRGNDDDEDDGGDDDDDNDDDDDDDCTSCKAHRTAI